MKRVLIVGALAALITAALADAPPAPAPTATPSPVASAPPPTVTPPGFNGPKTPPPQPPEPQMQLTDVLLKAQHDSSNIATCRTRKWTWDIVHPGIVILTGTSYMIFNQQETPAGGFIVARTLSGGERKPNLHDAQVRATEMATDDCSMGLAP